MKVMFRQTGGFAGQVRGCELDEDELDDEEGRTLRKLVDRAVGESFERRNPNVRDAEVYELRIERDGEPIRVAFDEASMTEELAPLVEFLQRAAAPRPLDDPLWRDVKAIAGLAGVFFDIGDTLARARWDGGTLELEPIEGVVGSLTDLRRRSIPLGIISNTPTGYSQGQMDALLADAGLLEFFAEELRIFSSVVGFDKSTPKIFDLAASRIPQLESPRLLYVGEDTSERTTAESAGWKSAEDIDAALELVRSQSN